MLAGLVLGIPAAMATARLMRSQLYGLGPYDPMTMLFAVGVMTGRRGAGLLSPGHTRDADRSDGGVAIRVDGTKLLELSFCHEQSY